MVVSTNWVLNFDCYSLFLVFIWSFLLFPILFLKFSSFSNLFKQIKHLKSMPKNSIIWSLPFVYFLLFLLGWSCLLLYLGIKIESQTLYIKNIETIWGPVWCYMPLRGLIFTSGGLLKALHFHNHLNSVSRDGMIWS